MLLYAWFDLMLLYPNSLLFLLLFSYLSMYFIVEFLDLRFKTTMYLLSADALHIRPPYAQGTHVT